MSTIKIADMNENDNKNVRLRISTLFILAFAGILNFQLFLSIILGYIITMLFLSFLLENEINSITDNVDSIEEYTEITLFEIAMFTWWVVFIFNTINGKIIF